jgi:2'-5' RNA ligase
LRLFIAVELPEGWTAALRQTQALLRRQGFEPLRWVRPEGAHLTLKFLGNVEAGRVDDLIAALRPAAAASGPFTLRLGGLGSFGPPARPRVLWAGVRGDLHALTRLWQAVEASIGPLGFPPERERFSPHLTLARVPEHLPRTLSAGIPAALAAIDPPTADPLLVREISLMRSHLGPGGARYERLAAAALTGK